MLHKKLDAMQKDLTEIKVEIGILKEWKRSVKVYTYSVWLMVLAFIGQKFGIKS